MKIKCLILVRTDVLFVNMNNLIFILIKSTINISPIKIKPHRVIIEE